MLRLYLKKLWDTTEFAVGYAIMLICYCLVLQWFFLPRLPLQKIIPKEILIGCLALLSLFMMLVFIYRQRRDDKPGRRKYTKTITFPPPSFFKEFWEILRSKENLAHALAFLTLGALIFIPFGISAWETVWTFLLGMLLFLLILGAASLLINTYIWCLVRRRWYKHWQNTR